MRKAVTGLRAWLVQRLSAVYMLLFIVSFLVQLAVDAPRSYAAWHGWVTSSSMGVATGVFFAALLAHVWIGVRDVIMDYVRPAALRVSALTLLAFGLTATGLWVAQIFWTGHSIAAS